MLYHAPLATVPRLIASGRVYALGTKRRVRALVAICDGAREQFLALPKVSTGVRYSHNHETATNPKGVWTFSRIEAHA